MVLKTFEISLDINSSTVRKTNIELVSNDTSVYTFHISMYNGSTLLDLNTACSTSSISFLKADSNVVVGAPTKTASGLLNYSLGTNEIARSGRVKTTVELFGGTGSRISSNQFEFNVRDDFGTGITSTTDYPILTSLITDIESLVSGLDPSCVVVTNASGVITSQASGSTGQYLGYSTGATSPLYRTITASDVVITDSGGYFTSTDVESALQELYVADYSTETTETAPIISLPDSVIKGQLSATVQGRTYSNIEINGNFANGTTGWTAIFATASVTNNKLSLTGDGTSASFLTRQNTKPTTLNNKYFVKAKARVLDANCQSINLRVNGTDVKVVNTPVANTWYELTALVTGTGTSIYLDEIRAYYADAITANGKTMEIQEVVIIDLTTQADTETDLTKLSQKYSFVDGTKSTLSVGLKSVNINQFNAFDVVQSGFEYYFSSGGVTAYCDADGSITINNSTGATRGIRFNKRIPVKPNTNYNLSQLASMYRARIFVFDSSDSVIAELIGSSGTTNIQFLTGANASYIRYGYSGTESTLTRTNIQLEIGTVATLYTNHEVSEAYIGQELRSVPTTNDEFGVVNNQWRHLQKVDIKSLSSTSYDSLDTTTYTNVDIIKTTVVTGALVGTTGIDGSVMYFNSSGTQLTEIDATSIDYASSVNKFYWTATAALWIIATAGTHVSIASARTSLGTSTLYYELTTPVPTYIDGMGLLIAEPNGTIIIEPVIKDELAYDTSIALASGYTFKSTTVSNEFITLQLISTNDDNTLTYTNINFAATGAVTIVTALDSFTIASAATGNIYYYEVYYDSSLSCIPTLTYSYPENLSAAVHGNTDMIASLSKSLVNLWEYVIGGI